jgi:hypothetical protein
MGTVGLLVLIGCASVAMLLLIRTEARREEFATCLALGASKRRLAAGVAIEGGMAALIGAALSLPLPVTAWLFAALSTFQLPGGVNLELLELSVNPGVVTAAAAVAIIATLIVGGIAAAFGFAGPVAELLRMRAGSTPPLNRRRTHRVLVSAQVDGARAARRGRAVRPQPVQCARAEPRVRNGPHPDQYYLAVETRRFR